MKHVSMANIYFMNLIKIIKLIVKTKGYVNAVKRYISNSYDKTTLLELVTKDDQTITPILLAALGSNLGTF